MLCAEAEETFLQTMRWLKGQYCHLHMAISSWCFKRFGNNPLKGILPARHYSTDYNFTANVSMLFKQWIIKFNNIKVLSVQFSSVAQSCLTLCDPMNHSMSGLPVRHKLLESTQTHVH